jgi:hypothetical protein
MKQSKDDSKKLEHDVFTVALAAPNWSVIRDRKAGSMRQVRLSCF